MIIPNNLSQFKNKKILILVSSKQNMRMYEIIDNAVKIKTDIKTALLPYSDNEGFFRVRSGGKVIRSGSVKELRDTVVINEFIKKIKLEMKTIKPTYYGDIYLLVPSHLKNKILNVLPNTISAKVGTIIEGNFYSKSASIILKEIAKTQKRPCSVIKPKALKILKKSNRATKIIKGKHTKF